MKALRPDAMIVDAVVVMSFEMRVPFERQLRTTARDWVVTAGSIRLTSEKHLLMVMLTVTAVTNE